ncbi:MAG TPA: DUF3759 domain-containing protein [Yinghuangia sp.]|nr:DUF3759 domain-containing protein [Yinghuangia sp.]
MGLFADDSEEAATYHTCRNVPQNERIAPDHLAAAGAYAASLAWAGRLARNERPSSFDRARHFAAEAAEAFIDQAVKEHPVSAEDIARAKQLAAERYENALHAEYA